MSNLFAGREGAATVPLGIWVKLPAVEVVELAAHAGLDFVIIDLEHAPLGMETTAHLIASASARGVTPIVRVPGLDPALMQRLLDAGAGGLHVPHVETVADAKAIVEATRFPPLGSRGSGAMSRAGGWGRKGRAEYVREGNEDILVIAALESRQAIESADDLLAVDGIDGIFVGAGDLSLSLDRKVTDPEVQRLVDDAIAAAARAGKPCGGAMRDGAQAIKGVSRGFGFLTLGNDTSILLNRATALVDEVRQGVGAA